jgi:DNA-binding CsgD family transcriptional regulator
LKPLTFFQPIRPHVLQAIRRGLLDLNAGEIRILAEFLDGRTARDMAPRLSISPRTVEKHRQNIIEKTGCSVLELVRACCYELCDDEELWRILGERAISYKSLQGRRPRRARPGLEASNPA